MKERWEKLSAKERQVMVNAINDSLDHTDEVIRAKGNRSGFTPVTVASLSSGVAAGLLAGTAPPVRAAATSPESDRVGGSADG